MYATIALGMVGLVLAMSAKVRNVVLRTFGLVFWLLYRFVISPYSFLSWLANRKSGSGSGPGGKRLVKRRRSTMTVTEMVRFAEEASKGAEFLKFGRWGSPHIRTVRWDRQTDTLFFGKKRTDPAKSIPIRDILQITTGIESDVLMKNRKLCDELLVFSVQTKSRTLDLQAEDLTQRVMWVEGLRGLMEGKHMLVDAKGGGGGSGEKTQKKNVRIDMTPGLGAFAVPDRDDDDDSKKKKKKKSQNGEEIKMRSKYWLLNEPWPWQLVLETGIDQKEIDRVEELREAMPAEYAGDNRRCDNFTLYRFQQCHDSIDECAEQLTNHFKWRDQIGADNILDQVSPYQQCFSSCIPESFHGHDKKGRPLYIQKFGQTALKDLKKYIDVETFSDIHIRFMEFCRWRARVATKESGRHIQATSAIFDFAGVGLSHRAMMDYLKAISKIDIDHYPGTVGQFFFVNCPSMVKWLWSLASVFVLPETAEKFVFLKSAKMDTLLDYIDANQLPEEYGGTCCCPDQCVPILDPAVRAQVPNK